MSSTLVPYRCARFWFQDCLSFHYMSFTSVRYRCARFWFHTIDTHIEYELSDTALLEYRCTCTTWESSLKYLSLYSTMAYIESSTLYGSVLLYSNDRTFLYIITLSTDENHNFNHSSCTTLKTTRKNTFSHCSAHVRSLCRLPAYGRKRFIFNDE